MYDVCAPFDMDYEVKDLTDKKLEVQLARVLLDNNLFEREGLEPVKDGHPQATFVWCFGAGPFLRAKVFAYGHTVREAHDNWRRKVRAQGGG